MRPSHVTTNPIMIVDDDVQSLTLLKSLLCHDGLLNVITFDDSSKSLDYFEKEEVAAIVLDLSMPHFNGKYLLDVFSRKKPHIPVIVVTAESHIDSAIECMKIGAVDYLTKPISINRFLTSINRALELRALNEDIISLEHSPEAASPVSRINYIITQNKEMLSLQSYIEIVANSHQPVLITGETGVGKELFAKAIHDLSGQKGEFVSVNIAGLDDLMFSDTLFGHRKGAYTGAIFDRDGLIMKAVNGTILLDEIGDLSEHSQVKLLRLLQENEYYQLGSDNPLKSHARLVVTTNQNLKQRMNEGKFRKDLYYRLCTHQVVIPPLRKRQDDIPFLLDHFIKEAASSMGKGQLSYRKDLLDVLRTYDFPGNIREFQAMVFDFVSRNTASNLSSSLFRKIIERERGSDPSRSAYHEGKNDIDFNGVNFSSFPTLKDAKNMLIQKALEIANGNQGIASQMLGITRQALNNHLLRSKRKA
jgi:DNA-binding NtrC family response regulator